MLYVFSPACKNKAWRVVSFGLVGNLYSVLWLGGVTAGLTVSPGLFICAAHLPSAGTLKFPLTHWGSASHKQHKEQRRKKGKWSSSNPTFHCLPRPQGPSLSVRQVTGDHPLSSAWWGAASYKLLDCLASKEMKERRESMIFHKGHSWQRSSSCIWTHPTVTNENHLLFLSMGVGIKGCHVTLWPNEIKRQEQIDNTGQLNYLHLPRCPCLLSFSASEQWALLSILNQLLTE